MPRQTKEERIAILEERIAVYESAVERLEKRNAELVAAEEGTFLHSPTYIQMKEYAAFMENINKLNEYHSASLRTQIKRADDSIQQILEDNKKITSESADIDYFVGITENWHDAFEFEKLKKEIMELQGKIEQKDQSIKVRDEEISRLQLALGEKIVQEQENITRRAHGR